MITFLEFYQALLGFVNFKLYTDMNTKYPPRLDARMDEHGAGMISSYILEAKKDIIPASSDAQEVVDRTKQKVPSWRVP